MDQEYGLLPADARQQLLMGASLLAVAKSIYYGLE